MGNVSLAVVKTLCFGEDCLCLAKQTFAVIIKQFSAFQNCTKIFIFLAFCSHSCNSGASGSFQKHGNTLPAEFYNWAPKISSTVESGRLVLAWESAYVFNICMLANQIEVITKRPVISILLVLLGIKNNGQKKKKRVEEEESQQRVVRNRADRSACR